MSSFISLFFSFGLLVWSFSIQAVTFPLPANYFVPAKMPMHTIYPRPDTETQLHARHRWAHPNITYEIPIGIQGGAWPFKYELVTAPSNATIGSFVGDSNYGVINWKAPSSGSFIFKVRVTDQELNFIDLEWNVKVDANQFIFIQDGYTGSKIGTIDQPLEDIVDWYKNDENDATFKNKIIVFRGGDYKLKGDPNRNNNLRLNASTKTPSLISYPNEIPVIDASSSKVFTDSNSLRDIFVAGIRWNDARQDVANAHFWWATGDVSRSTWWRNHWDNLKPGQVGNDNTLAVFISNTPNIKNNVLYKSNLHTRISNKGFNGGYFEAYRTSYLLIEENIARNSDVASGWFPKATIAYVTIRANEAYDNVDGGQITIGYADAAGEVPHHHEICWNRIALNSTNASTYSLQWANSNSNEGKSYKSYIYRNTFVNGSAWVRFQGKDKYQVDGNVVVSDNLARWNTSIMDTIIPNLTGGTSKGITDSTGKLLGKYRNDFLGIRGFEVFGLNDVLRPLAPLSLEAQ